MVGEWRRYDRLRMRRRVLIVVNGVLYPSNVLLVVLLLLPAEGPERRRATPRVLSVLRGGCLWLGRRSSSNWWWLFEIVKAGEFLGRGHPAGRRVVLPSDLGKLLVVTVLVGGTVWVRRVVVSRAASVAS
jgi:hypothetical protein